jgi:hypothetical protein
MLMHHHMIQGLFLLLSLTSTSSLSLRSSLLNSPPMPVYLQQQAQ